MEAKLIVMGEERGTIEIGDGSIIGQLLAGNMVGATLKLAEMQDEINEIGGPGTCRVNVSEEANDDNR